MSNKMAAGGFLTTSNDLILFTKALLNKKLINSASLNQMFSIQIFSDGDVVNYGYGCVVNNNNKDFYNLTEVLHGGGTPGVSNLLYILPEKRFAIAILANREDIDDRVDIARNIARIYLNLK
jgi:CubicO group peptidase (beta-lactamase class C family)